MNLSHFSEKPLTRVRSAKQKPRYDTPSCYDKPLGLWVSVDGEDDWEWWCKAESFGLGKLRHRIVLANQHNILHIDNGLDLACFAERFGRMESDRSYARPYIDWAEVAKHHDGIIIAPYQWHYRLKDGYSWYYGWDCASGCIWNAKAVSAVVPTVAAGEGG